MTEPNRIIRAGDERLVVVPKTLIVEDEPDLLTTCVRLLVQLGHVCLTARTGGAAIGLIDAERPDLVVTDLRLPTVDGLAVVRHARRACPPVPAILITAYTSAESRREAHQAGATIYLPKPFSRVEFLGAVQSALATGSAEGPAVAPPPQFRGPLGFP
ncbi:MAG: response regulator [Candidatus Rokubacteria bacterium]|nr:response regulator [Candidatus Rokubacteria bacterium]